MKPYLLLFPLLVLIPAPSMAQEKAEKSPAARKLEALQKQIDELIKVIRFRIDKGAIQKELSHREPEFRTVTPKPVKTEKPKPSPAISGTKKPLPVKGAADEEPGPPAPQPQAGDQPATELTPGAVILKADGVPITNGEVEQLVQYVQSYSPNRPPHEIQQEILVQLIQRAKVQAAYQEKLPEMRKRIDALRARIVDKGEIFADVAQANSDCPSKRNGGDLGEFGRTGMVQPFGMIAFTSKRAEVSQPFLTPFGYHIIKVIKQPMGPDAANLRVRARHILVAFDKNSNKVRSLMEQARQGKVKITGVHPSFRNHLPAQFMAK